MSLLDKQLVEVGVMYTHYENELDTRQRYKVYYYYATYLPTRSTFKKKIFIMSGNIEDLLKYWNTKLPEFWTYRLANAPNKTNQKSL